MGWKPSLNLSRVLIVSSFKEDLAIEVVNFTFVAGVKRVGIENIITWMWVGGEEGECQQMMVMILFPKSPLFIFRDPPPLSYFPNCWNNSLFMLLLSTPLLVALLRVTVGSDSLVSRFMVTIGKINACRFPWKRNEASLQTPSLVWDISGHISYRKMSYVYAICFKTLYFQPQQRNNLRPSTTKLPDILIQITKYANYFLFIPLLFIFMDAYLSHIVQFKGLQIIYHYRNQAFKLIFR